MSAWVRIGFLGAILCLCLVPSAEAGKRDDSRVRAVIRNAITLLDDLEYERGRELLEAAARDRRNKKAKPVVQAKLWAVLGRARAELADHMGGDDAFDRAVKLDNKVKLSRSTSPKIREALERARSRMPMEAPPTVLAVAPPPPSKEPPPPKTNKAPPKTNKVPPPKTNKAPPKTNKAPPKTNKAPPKTNKAPPPVTTAESDPKQPPSSKAKLQEHRSREGMLVTLPESPDLGTLVRLSISGLKANTPVDAYVRRTQSGPFVPLVVTWDGPEAEARFTMEGARVEWYVRTERKGEVDQVGSPTEPKVLRAKGAPPSVEQAWANAPPPSTTTSTTGNTVAGEPTPTLVSEPPSSGLSGAEVAVIAVSSAIVVAGVTALVIVFASRTPECAAPEGFGCTDIQVLPLLSF